MVKVNMRRVNSLMAAFRYGGNVDDLCKVDRKHENGTYDYVQWHVALDGATLYGFDAEFKRHLVNALSDGISEMEAESIAYTLTAVNNGMAV